MILSKSVAELQREHVVLELECIDLRRLRLHRLIERIRGKHRYQLTALGRRTALFYSRTFNHVLRPGLSQIAHSTLSPDQTAPTSLPHSIISNSS